MSGHYNSAGSGPGKGSSGSRQTTTDSIYYSGDTEAVYYEENNEPTYEPPPVLSKQEIRKKLGDEPVRKSRKCLKTAGFAGAFLTLFMVLTQWITIEFGGLLLLLLLEGHRCCPGILIFHQNKIFV